MIEIMFLSYEKFSKIWSKKETLIKMVSFVAVVVIQGYFRLRDKSFCFVIISLWGHLCNLHTISTLTFVCPSLRMASLKFYRSFMFLIPSALSDHYIQLKYSGEARIPGRYVPILNSKSVRPKAQRLALSKNMTQIKVGISMF